MRCTVLVPTYQRPALLQEALASLAAQTMRGFEVLVLNDGGPSIGALPLPAFDPRPDIRVLGLDLPHGGQSAALNAGLALARGTYVTVAQDDDLVLPEKLAVLAAALDAAPMDAGAVYSLPLYTTADGRPLEMPPRLRSYLDRHPVVTWADVERDGLFLHGTGTLYRRAALRAVNGWDETLRTAEEFDLHLRLLKAGWTFHAVDAVTVTYRRHPAGKSQDRFRRRKLRRGVMAGIYDRLGLRPRAEVA